MLTTTKLWDAYARVQESRVRGADVRHQMIDLVALVRFALGLDDELRPFADAVDKKFAEWVFRHNGKRTTAFTPEQMDWLRLMKTTSRHRAASNATISTTPSWPHAAACRRRGACSATSWMG